MPHKRKIITIAALVVFVILGSAASVATETKFRNLKVLPQDISDHKLDSIMDSFNRALKVNCDFCHIAPKNTSPLAPVADGNLDFALDNQMKEEARRMMRMTMDINKTYFHADSTIKAENVTVISCNTCHRGNPFPANE